MKVTVDSEVCSSYGMCVETVAAVFSFNPENDLVIATDIPTELEDRVCFACEQCPSQALSVQD